MTAPAPTRTALVIPSNRSVSLSAWLLAWRPFPWDDTIVVFDDKAWDGDRDLLLHTGANLVLDWSHADDMEKEARGLVVPLFSRRDSAIRCLGFLEAVRRGAQVVLTLDDDCLPRVGPKAFLNQHVHNLSGRDVWASTVPGMRTRGLPYRLPRDDRPVALSMGLWSGHPDQDAACQLREPVTGFEPPPGVRLMHPDQLFPLCGMNLAFRRELLPAMYFPFMGEGSPYARFDDIWCGLVSQTVCATLGWGVVVGEPHVRHARASDPMRNLVKEAPGVAAHEQFWRMFRREEIAGLSAGDTPGETVRKLADHLVRVGPRSPDPNYVTRWGHRLTAWAKLAECALSGGPSSAGRTEAPPGRSSRRRAR